MAEYNFTKEYKSAYPAGRFDLALNLIDGNPQMYRFFGNKAYFSFYRLLDDAEKEKISALADLCREFPDNTNEECVHIHFGDITECYVLSMTKETCNDAYYVELINVSGIKNTINALNERITLARDFLTLQGEAVFTYSPDTNIFHMFVVNNSQNVELYNMDFDEWISYVHSKNLISKDDIDIFETFCYILKNADARHSFKFHGDLLTFKNTVEKYKVSFEPKINPDGEKIITGTWAIINEFTNDSEDNVFDAAYIDSLTGLLNKKAIMQYAKNAVDSVTKTGNQVAITVMDIDNFKGVNDNYGHLFGDKVIKAVGEIIKESIGSDAVAGRMGGDEFLIVFEKFKYEFEYRNVLRCIKTKANYVYQNIFGSDNKLSCSIGLGRYGVGPNSTSFGDLFKIADKALYLAKQKGKNRYIIYKPELHGTFISSNENDDIVNIATNYYSQESIDKLNSLLSDTIIYGCDVIDDLIEQLSKLLMFDRLNIFLHDNHVPEYATSTSLAKSGGYSNPDIIKDKNYISIFTKNQIVISNINGIEFTLPETYRILSDEGINSLMQFLFTDRDGKIVGFITGEVLGHFATFPKIAVTMFEATARAINSVLIREGKI